jgi:DNA-binding MarR family transcriptional regulator
MAAPPPFVEDYLLALLARASHAASAEFHARLKARGVAVPAWRVLASLAGQPRPVGELARICLMQQPTMSKLLDRMAADGLVRRARAGRETRIALTDQGQALSDSLIAEARAHEAALLARHAEAAPALKALLRALVPAPPEAS